jgi:hypothetical protein
MISLAVLANEEQVRLTELACGDSTNTDGRRSLSSPSGSGAIIDRRAKLPPNRSRANGGDSDGRRRSNRTGWLSRHRTAPRAVSPLPSPWGPPSWA